MVNQKLQKEDLTFEEYAVNYKAQTSRLSSSLIILNVPVLALFLSLIYFRKRMYFADHFIFSLYLFGFVLLLVLTLSGIYYLIDLGLNQIPFNPGVLLLIAFEVYLFVGLRHVYEQKYGLLWSLCCS
ncbi:MAG: hypothetical protein HC811_04395 [Flammeovirgaceae bacterium]|nr:hypothetical protein [Flammeovirgaceae bacterium]